MKVELSIIIISYNTSRLLDRCLATLIQSLKHVEFVYEIIVVDNHSSDKSIEMVRQNYKSVRLIENQENVGFGKANNQGARLAIGEALLFLNSDIEVLDDAINKLLTFFKNTKQPVIVGGKLFNTDMTPQPSAGPAYTLKMIFTALFLKGDYTGLTRYSPNTTKKVDWIMGACMMMSRRYFLDVGGFDEGIFMYMEEIDFEHRAVQKNATIYFYPDAHFIHVGAGSSNGRFAPILNVYRGFIYFYKKHRSYAAQIILRSILLLKSLSAIFLFTILNKNDDRKLYIESLKIPFSYLW